MKLSPYENSWHFLIFVILSAVTSVISITIFGFGLEQKPCMDRLPWNLMELIYPVFMVILLGCAAIGTNNTFISIHSISTKN